MGGVGIGDGVETLNILRGYMEKNKKLALQGYFLFIDALNEILTEVEKWVQNTKTKNQKQ